MPSIKPFREAIKTYQYPIKRLYVYWRAQSGNDWYRQVISGDGSCGSLSRTADSLVISGRYECSITLPSHLAAQLRAVTKDRGLSVNGVIIQFIQAGLTEESRSG